MRDAMELMLTGNAIDAPEAVRMHLANRCYPDDEIEDQVLAIANRIAKIPKASASGSLADSRAPEGESS
jgi:enoyl-CoA hydratase